MICVGIDVAKDKHDCFIISSEGEVLADVFTIQNNAEGFDMLLQTIRRCARPEDKIKVGLEATGHYSYNILGFLLDKGLDTYVINPLHTNLYRKSLSLRKTKTDRVDARTIAAMLMSDVDLKPYTDTAYHNEELKSLTRYRFARRDLPVLFHMGDDRYDFSSPERLTNLLRRVPELRAVAAHFGGWRSWTRSLAHLQPESVLYDTSSTLGMIDRDMVLRFIDAIGPDRLIFGTDFPMWSPKEELNRFFSLGLSESDQQKILYGNFMKLLGLRDEE